MTSPAARPRITAFAVLLLLAGVILCALYRVASGAEHHSYSSGALAPESVRLTEGKSYQLSIPGGIATLLKQGKDVTAPSCQWSVDGAASQALTVAPSGADTKATNVVATFVAPYTGKLHIDCIGWGAVYVDDADDSAGDLAGWFLVFGVIALTVGVALGLSALRTALQRSVTDDSNDSDYRHHRPELNDASEDTVPSGDTVPSDGTAASDGTAPSEEPAPSGQEEPIVPSPRAGSRGWYGAKRPPGPSEPVGPRGWYGPDRLPGPRDPGA